MRKLFFILIILFVQCSTERSVSPVTDSFFDLDKALEEYFGKQKVKVEKEVSYNGKSSRKTYEYYDLTEDLESFSLFNVNNPNWYDKFQVDSTMVGQKLQITYTALTGATDIKACTTTFVDTELQQVQVNSQKNGLIADVDKQLNWDLVSNNIEVESSQILLWGDMRSFKLILQF